MPFGLRCLHLKPLKVAEVPAKNGTIGRPLPAPGCTATAAAAATATVAATATAVAAARGALRKGVHHHGTLLIELRRGHGQKLPEHHPVAGLKMTSRFLLGGAGAGDGVVGSDVDDGCS